MVVLAVVGLPGAGKSVVIDLFREAGWNNVYCADVVFDEMKRRGLEVNEVNERLVRESLREQHGINAVERLSLPRVKEASRKGDVTVESFYSWESYPEYKSFFGDEFLVLAVHASPRVREQRLASRKVRALSPEETRSRTWSQIENLHQAGPIAVADFHLVNEGSLADLRASVSAVLESFKAGG